MPSVPVIPKKSGATSHCIEKSPTHLPFPPSAQLFSMLPVKAGQVGHVGKENGGVGVGVGVGVAYGEAEMEIKFELGLNELDTISDTTDDTEGEATGELDTISDATDDAEDEDEGSTDELTEDTIGIELGVELGVELGLGDDGDNAEDLD
jgi:hypothetical protein